MSHLPDVIYIGLQKTGSTFLRHYFWNHDDIYCDRHGIFFQTSEADIASRSPDAIRADYAALFPQRAPRACHIDMYEAIGMGYLFRDRPAWEGAFFLDPDGSLITGPARADPEAVADRVHAIVPQAKILITVRNQIAWLDSGYRHFLAHLPPSRRRFVDFLATPEGKLSLEAGHFDRLVSLYDNRFGRNRVHVIPLELLEASEAASLDALAGFLGVRSLPYAPERKSFNRGQQVDLDGTSGRPLSLAQRILRKRFPGRSSVIPPDVMSALSSMFAAGNVRLGERLGVDIDKLGYPV